MNEFIEILNELDARMLLAVNGLHCSFFDGFMYDFSGKWIWVGLYVAMFYAMIRRFGWMRGMVFAIGAGLTIVFADQMCATVIRPYVARLRPANPDNPLSAFVHIVNNYRGGSYGFPSCHAANTFGAAVFTSLCFRQRRYTVFIFAWAVVSCWSRMYLGVHYPGDLLVGAIVGSVGAVAIYWFMAKVNALLPGKPIEGDEKTPACALKPQAGGFVQRVRSRFVPSDVPVAVGLLLMFWMAVKAAVV